MALPVWLYATVHATWIIAWGSASSQNSCKKFCFKENAEKHFIRRNTNANWYKGTAAFNLQQSFHFII